MKEKTNECHFKAEKKVRNRLDKYKSIMKTKRRGSFRGNKNANEPDSSYDLSVEEVFVPA